MADNDGSLIFRGGTAFRDGEQETIFEGRLADDPGFIAAVDAAAGAAVTDARVAAQVTGGDQTKAALIAAYRSAVLATEFGAVGDGATSNDAALAAALAATRGRALALPAGEFLVTTATRLLLEGNFSSIIGDPSGAGTIIRFTDAAGGLDIGNGTDNVYENRLVNVMVLGSGVATTLVRARKMYEPYLVDCRFENTSAAAGSTLLLLQDCGQLDANRIVLSTAPIGIQITGTTSPIASVRLANLFNLTEPIRFAGSGIAKFTLLDSWMEDCPDLYTVNRPGLPFSIGEIITERIHVLKVTGNQRLFRTVAASAINSQVVDFAHCYVEAFASTTPLFDLSAFATGGTFNISGERLTVLYANVGPMLAAHAAQPFNLLVTDFSRISGVPPALWSPSPMSRSWPRPPILFGAGVPAFDAPAGSMYVRSDAFPGFYPALYLKHNAGDTTWHAVGTERAIVPKTSNYTATLADEVIIGNGSSIAIQLPNAALYHGRSWTIKNIHATSLSVTSAGGTIDGAASTSLAQWAKATFISDSTNWLTV